MRASVYSLGKTLFNDEAVSINCRTLRGEITVLDHHRPLISVLEKGTVIIVSKEHKESYIPISSGFLEVISDNQIKLIVEEVLE